MRVLIVSDSHGREMYLERVLRIAAPFDMFIHLGDLEGSQQYIEENVTCPVEMVSGNNDFFSDLEREVISKSIEIMERYKESFHIVRMPNPTIGLVKNIMR